MLQCVTSPNIAPATLGNDVEMTRWVISTAGSMVFNAMISHRLCNARASRRIVPTLGIVLSMSIDVRRPSGSSLRQECIDAATHNVTDHRQILAGPSSPDDICGPSSRLAIELITRTSSWFSPGWPCCSIGQM
jgi:hypothetical protein